MLRGFVRPRTRAAARGLRLRVAATARVREPLATLARATRGLALAASAMALLAADVIGSTVAEGAVAEGAVPESAVDADSAVLPSVSLSGALSGATAPNTVGPVEPASDGAAPLSLVGAAASGSRVAMSLSDGVGRSSTAAGSGSSACAADCVRPAYASPSQRRATVLSRGAITAISPRSAAAAKSASAHGRR